MGNINSSGDDSDLKVVHRMTVIKRIIHWTLFLSIINQIITGMYIAYPFLIFGKTPTQADSPISGVLNSGETYQAFIMTWMREFHFIGAVLIDVSFFAWVYLAFFSTKEPLYKSFLPFGNKINEMYKMIKHYFTLKNKPKTGKYQDPLNAIIFTFFHLLLLLQMATGFQMYVASFTGTSAVGAWWPAMLHICTDWTLWVFGGLTGVTLTHLFITWLIIIFIFYHIYIEVWRSIVWKEGDILIPFGGYKYSRDNLKEDDAD
ncbi:MAG: Ni/Fe hydrogenase [Candidatus Acididesulfobacter guangdongensis]|uniref:Ni/Fe hydrogenase n=1 Tax=Acididesulfobacter guangdongensis TaxID=2597225 RepID=A0A519BFK0_ACIG2|nr:MAG: Ni/Fe hydrogenase [Candidatus Acididesulfobacter guangdongensis]